MEKVIKILKQKYSEAMANNNLRHNDIMFPIIYNGFLREMGYDDCNICDSGNNLIRIGKSDLLISINQNTNLIVNVVDGSEDIKIVDIIQFLKHLKKNKIEYGIITNGHRFILLSPDLECNQNNLNEQYIFDFDVLKDSSNRLKYFQYLSKELLFIKGVTKYYKYMAQFRIIKQNKKEKWGTYESTLLRFFDYLSKQPAGFKILEKISEEDFTSFIEYTQNINAHSKKPLTQKDSLKNNYSHISSMLKQLESNNLIGEPKFNFNKKEVLKRYEETQRRKLNKHLASEDIEIMIQYLKTTVKDHRARNIAILLLCTYIGLEKSKICNLKWEQISDDNKYIEIENRKIPICRLLQDCIIKLRNRREEKNINLEYVFDNYYSDKYTPLSNNTANTIFNSLAEFLKSKNKPWENICPQTIRYNLINTMFFSGFTIDEIIYATGIDIKNIGKYISTNDIIGKIKDNKSNTINKNISDEYLKDISPNLQFMLIKHPFSDIFNNSLD